jgi:uncharacterized protein (TIGR01777 family)
MRIAVTGSTGLIGSALTPLLEKAGHEVTRLRRPAHWNPENSTVDLSAFRGLDVLVHLAGENIAGGRWTPGRKRRIRDSRISGTKLIADTLSKSDSPPQVLISASAIGYYGNRGDEILQEASEPGTGFLAEVCQQWEAATATATRAGIRVVHLRLGIVLSRKGGALSKMLLPFKFGAGGRIGSGLQYWSWISLEDVCGVVEHCIQATGLHGPVNAVSPLAVTNLEFTKCLGRALRRPTVFPLPSFAARLALGEMADALLLASARVEPAKLLASRFVFRHRDLGSALQALLGQS